MMPSGVRNSCDTMDTKLLRNWPSSFSRANVRSSSASCDCHEGWAGAKGSAKALFTLPQPGLAFAQQLFRARAV
jgi:hypothetical protein